MEIDLRGKLYVDDQRKEFEGSSHVGIYFQGENARENFMMVEITMPCGHKIIYEDTGKIPTVDTPCPCGDPSHWIVKFQ